MKGESCWKAVFAVRLTAAEIGRTLIGVLNVVCVVLSDEELVVSSVSLVRFGASVGALAGFEVLFAVFDAISLIICVLFCISLY